MSSHWESGERGSIPGLPISGPVVAEALNWLLHKMQRVGLFAKEFPDSSGMAHLCFHSCLPLPIHTGDLLNGREGTAVFTPSKGGPSRRADPCAAFGGCALGGEVTSLSGEGETETVAGASRACSSSRAGRGHEPGTVAVLLG